MGNRSRLLGRRVRWDVEGTGQARRILELEGVGVTRHQVRNWTGSGKITGWISGGTQHFDSGIVVGIKVGNEFFVPRESAAVYARYPWEAARSEMDKSSMTAIVNTSHRHETAMCNMDSFDDVPCSLPWSAQYQHPTH